MQALLIKDFSVIKRYILIMLAVGAALPPLMLVDAASQGSSPEAAGSIAFALAIIYVAGMSLLQLAQKESANHQAIALLCTTPIRRSLIVLSTYIFIFMLIGILLGIYAFEALFFPALLRLPPLLPPASFCLLALIIGTMIPLLYGLGFDRTKMLLPVILVATPFVIAWLLSHTPLLDWLKNSTQRLQIILWSAGSIYLGISIFLSVRIFSNADVR